VEHRHVWIAMEDGTRLAARLFLPDELPAPAIVDALPYRMDDLTASYASQYERLSEEAQGRPRGSPSTSTTPRSSPTSAR